MKQDHLLTEMNSTASSAFRSSSRRSAPSWSNRFRKDVNDLIYNVKDLKDIQYHKSTKSNIIHEKNKNPMIIAM